MQAAFGDLVHGGAEQGDVVAVRAVGGPADRDARCVGRDRGLPARFAPVDRAFAGSGPAAGGFVDRPVDAHISQLQAHDAVPGGERLGGYLVEHPSSDPFVAAGPQRGVRHLVAQQDLHGLPRATQHQPPDDALQAQPVAHPGPVTAQRMIVGRAPQQRLHSRPHDIHHSLGQSAHDEFGLQGSPRTGQPDRYTAKPNDPWTAAYRRGL